MCPSRAELKTPKMKLMQRPTMIQRLTVQLLDGYKSPYIHLETPFFFPAAESTESEQVDV
jgi:hypothetical protein